ncbi:chromate transporter [Xanthobacter versatilis]|uniref:chromate transporter n=1 Tax=Xanthobacter autotrophicus (strain ATCC BAA-1158 / Py2) TaxID=78245 RepID=UPI00372D67A6
MVLQFVGFLAAYRAPGALNPMLAGCLGALFTLWVTFAPCFFWIFLGAPYVEALRGNRELSAALSAITAAVVGVILNLALWFAIHVVFRQTVNVDWHGVEPDLPLLSSIDWRASTGVRPRSPRWPCSPCSGSGSGCSPRSRLAGWRGCCSRCRAGAAAC